MSAQHLGYVRVSTSDQSTARQLAGFTLDRVFTDYASGKDRNRPQLDALLKHARPGDTIHVHSIARFARSVADLGILVTGLTERGIRIEFHKEGSVFAGDRNPLSDPMMNLIGAIAQFERSKAASGSKSDSGRANAL